MNSYTLGDVVRVTGTLADVDGTVGDPGALVVKYRDPAGSITTKTYGTDVAVVKVSTGIYYVDITASQEGVWHIRFVSTGTRAAAAESRFTVRESLFN